MKSTLIACALTLVLGASSAFAGGDIQAGEAKSAICASCHGADGVSPSPIYPHIGGQYADYLLVTLRDYKSGKRQNPAMQGMVTALSDADLKNLAAYYASLPGVLKDGTLKP